MADMELLIKIPEEVYKDGTFLDYFHVMSSELVEIIYNGTVLPKGHGDLIDSNVLCEQYEKTDGDLYQALDLTPTIIEADKGE